jgi:hypothetical protein
MYRCVAYSVEGFVQQLAVAYISRGYWFYVTGRMPDHKEPSSVDRKLIERYDIAASKWQRARRKRGGTANLQYLRYDRFFVILATHGAQRFFQVEPFRDVREDPIRFHGYSIGCGKGADGHWHASVRIHAEEYKSLKALFLELAAHRSVEDLVQEFQGVRFAPFARVRRQMLNILRAVNRARKEAGLEPIPLNALRLRRRPVGVFRRRPTPIVDDDAKGEMA